jgi:hypothetical protein
MILYLTYMCLSEKHKNIDVPIVSPIPPKGDANIGNIVGTRKGPEKITITVSPEVVG